MLVDVVTQYTYSGLDVDIFALFESFTYINLFLSGYLYQFFFFLKTPFSGRQANFLQQCFFHKLFFHFVFLQILISFNTPKISFCHFRFFGENLMPPPHAPLSIGSCIYAKQAGRFGRRGTLYPLFSNRRNFGVRARARCARTGPTH